MNASNKPVPVPSPETVAYHEAANRGELFIRYCGSCDRYQAPDLPVCRTCADGETRWTRASGRGTIFSFVTYRRAYHPAFADGLPYVVALVELEEGVRLIGNIVDPDEREVRCGLRVAVIFEQRDGQAVPQFKIVDR